MDGSFLFHFLFTYIYSGFFLHAHIILAFTVIAYIMYKLYLILMQPHILYENNKTNHLNNHKLYFIFQHWANVAPTL